MPYLQIVPIFFYKSGEKLLTLLLYSNYPLWQLLCTKHQSHKAYFSISTCTYMYLKCIWPTHQWQNQSQFLDQCKSVPCLLNTVYKAYDNLFQQFKFTQGRLPTQPLNSSQTNLQINKTAASNIVMNKYAKTHLLVYPTTHIYAKTSQPWV